MRRKAAPAPQPASDASSSEDELAEEDSWDWIYAAQADETASARKRKRDAPQQQRHRIVGARGPDGIECRIGDCFFLDSGPLTEVWVAMLSEFVEQDEDGDKAAVFIWFARENEVWNKDKKRRDGLDNELYLTPGTDINPLNSINGRAFIMSPAKFAAKYPGGKVPRSSPGFNKTFVVRRGCNARTASYTDEFVWEDMFHGEEEDVANLLRFVQRGTTSTRRRVNRVNRATDRDFITEDEDGDPDEEYGKQRRRDTRDASATVSTPRKRQKTTKIVTPSNRKVMVKKALEFTPLGTRILSPNHHHGSPFQLARAQLHVASVPTSLPCRESEFSLVYSHLEAAITDGSGACIYISGTPGTGKTATVREVVTRLDDAVRSDELDDFIFVEINGMKITDPHQSYALLWEALKGQRVSPSQALDLLEREFSHPSPRRVPCVVLMDELDQLVTKNQSVMYNFFNWPGLRHSRLIVLAVANTMDLPERTLSNKISSRLGLTRITFPGYNHEQLMRIIQSRLEGVPGHVVEPDAVQFASRKVAAVSGDARRALDICRRAVELAEAEAKDEGASSAPSTPSKKAKEKLPAAGDKRKAVKGRVTIATIQRAISEATTSPLQQYLRALPYASKLVLASLLVRNQRTGLPDSTFGDVQEEMQRALVMDASSRRVDLLTNRAGVNADQRTRGMKGLAKATGMNAAAIGLTGAGIIILEGQRPERPSKIRLAVGDEEVKLAFRDDPEIRALGISFQ